SGVGLNQLSLGLIEDALESFRKARTAQTDPYTPRAGRNWRDIVQAQLGMKRIADAKLELAKFEEAANPAPPYFRAQSLLAKADIFVATGEYGRAVEAIKEVRKVIGGD